MLLRLRNKKVWAALLGLGVLLGSCGSNAQVGPLTFAYLVPTNFSTTGSLKAGSTDTYVAFDLKRQRDGALITDSLDTTKQLTVYVSNQGAASTQSDLKDQLNNSVYLQRAVVLLGNGIVKNGTLQDPPTTAPTVLQPLAPYSTPTGWSPRATLAYYPNQTTVPNRAAENRFGFYLASVLAFQSTLQVQVLDENTLTTSISQNYTVVAPDQTQSVTVQLSNTASTTQPILVSLCNQFNAAILIGVKSGSSAQIAVPALGSGLPNSLNTDTAYRVEAYQFSSQAKLTGVSDTVPLLDTTHITGQASLTLVASTDDTKLTCFGEKISSLQTTVPVFFAQ